jgi:hypothetical protein
MAAVKKVVKAKATVAKAKPKAKTSVSKKQPVAKVEEVKKPRKTRKAKSSFDELLKKQSELNVIKKAAKIELKKDYDAKMKEADDIKNQYKDLFDEDIKSAPSKSNGAKQGSAKNKKLTLDQVQSFIDQFNEGGKITITGKNAITVARIKEAYDKSLAKDAESVLQVLNK